MATVTMNNTQKVHFAIDPKDVNGASAPIEDLSGEALDDADLTVTIDEDQRGGYVISGTTIGAFRVRLHADAKIGDGVDALEEIHDVIITNPQATILGGTFGTPEAK